MIAIVDDTYMSFIPIMDDSYLGRIGIIHETLTRFVIFINKEKI